MLYLAERKPERFTWKISQSGQASKNSAETNLNHSCTSGYLFWCAEDTKLWWTSHQGSLCKCFLRLQSSLFWRVLITKPAHISIFTQGKPLHISLPQARVPDQAEERLSLRVFSFAKQNPLFVLMLGAGVTIVGWKIVTGNQIKEAENQCVMDVVSSHAYLLLMMAVFHWV